MRALIVAALAGVLAGGAGGWILRGQRPAAAATAPSQTPGRILVAPQACTGVTADQLRAILDEKLAAHTATAAQVAPAAATAAEPEPAAEPRATRAVDDGLADGVWSDEDRTALHRAMAETSATDAHDALSHLAVAINEGRVRVATSGNPF